jgi:molybdopterin synthase sulfur carrier subunit
MGVTVRVPTVLRRLAGDASEVSAAGANVGEVFQSIGRDHAALLQRITTETGELRPFLNVFVNGEDIRFAQGLDTPVRDGDEVSIIPSIAGG